MLKATGMVQTKQVSSLQDHPVFSMITIANILAGAVGPFQIPPMQGLLDL